MVWCLGSEGAGGVEGAVSLAAVQLEALTQALRRPHRQPQLALGAAALAKALAPYRSVRQRIYLHYCIASSFLLTFHNLTGHLEIVMLIMTF